MRTVVIRRSNFQIFVRREEVPKLSSLKPEMNAVSRRLDPNFFHVPFGGFSEDDTREAQRQIFHALSSLVRNPPLPPDASVTAENIEIWRVWWEKNKGEVEFNLPPRECIDCLTERPASGQEKPIGHESG